MALEHKYAYTISYCSTFNIKLPYILRSRVERGSDFAGDQVTTSATKYTTPSNRNPAERKQAPFQKRLSVNFGGFDHNSGQ